mmetsp:Transcript_49461/g.96746  ORF Transcript_49461/g.96746 Transcript_49461/m.96746 type:complete len:697 (-) Transcript_49461:460-2550(-)
MPAWTGRRGTRSCWPTRKSSGRPTSRTESRKKEKRHPKLTRTTRVRLKRAMEKKNTPTKEDGGKKKNSREKGSEEKPKGKSFKKLEEWVNNQRRRMQTRLLMEAAGEWPDGPRKRAAMTDANLASLRAAGFCFTAWDVMYEELLRWKARHPTTPYPKESLTNLNKIPTSYPDRELRAWLSLQRSNFRKWRAGKLVNLALMAEGRIIKLLRAGFEFDPPHQRPKKNVLIEQTVWKAKLSELTAYKEHFGDCWVPAKFPLNMALVKWVKEQRAGCRLFEEGGETHITEERLAELKKLGFFEPKKAAAESKETAAVAPDTPPSPVAPAAQRRGRSAGPSPVVAATQGKKRGATSTPPPRKSRRGSGQPAETAALLSTPTPGRGKKKGAASTAAAAKKAGSPATKKVTRKRGLALPETADVHEPRTARKTRGASKAATKATPPKKATPPPSAAKKVSSGTGKKRKATPSPAAGKRPPKTKAKKPGPEKTQTSPPAARGRGRKRKGSTATPPAAASSRGKQGEVEVIVLSDGSPDAVPSARLAVEAPAKTAGTEGPARILVAPPVGRVPEPMTGGQGESMTMTLVPTVLPDQAVALATALTPGLAGLATPAMMPGPAVTQPALEGPGASAVGVTTPAPGTPTAVPPPGGVGPATPAVGAPAAALPHGGATTLSYSEFMLQSARGRGEPDGLLGDATLETTI